MVSNYQKVKDSPLIRGKTFPKGVKKRGTNIKFGKRDYNIVENLAKEGNSRESIAKALGIHVSTFAEKLKIDTDLASALERGYASDIQEMTNVMRSRASDGDIHHMKAYFHVRHGFIIGQDEARRNLQSGVHITVRMPFPIELDVEEGQFTHIDNDAQIPELRPESASGAILDMVSEPLPAGAS